MKIQPMQATEFTRIHRQATKQLIEKSITRPSYSSTPNRFTDYFTHIQVKQIWANAIVPSLSCVSCTQML